MGPCCDAMGCGAQVAVVTASPTWVVVPGAVDLGLKESDVIGIDVRVHYT